MPMKTQSNPLLNLEALPPFSEIRPEHVEPAIDQLLGSARRRVDDLLAQRQSFTWRNLVEPLEWVDDRINRSWAPVSHLNAVVNSEELRTAYNACLPKLSEYATDMGHNAQLFRAYQEVYDAGGLDQAQRKLLENALRDFRLSGVDLPPERKARFKEISQELSRLGSEFEDNLLDSTHAWSKLITDQAELSGLPETGLALLRQAAAQREQEGWLLTLEMPSYLPVVTYADDRALREEIYHAYVTRASAEFPLGGQWDNSDRMGQILALRHEMAGLLAFKDYSELSLATKMAPSSDRVLEFLHDLARRSKPQAEREIAELEEFATGHGHRGPIEAWDIAYYSEKLRQHKHAVSQEELRPYFPAPRVIKGLFGVIERLFGMHVTEVEGIDTWHPDVRFFEVRDDTGELRGQFYLDLYARRNKRGGAWMADCVGRMVTEDWDQLPVAFLVCNFSPPVGERPTLLTHTEVLTLFHEFGHGLHHLLTRVDYPGVAGINGVAWDAVELPSQFMENWCWEREALDLISGHWETGEAIPDDLFQRMLAAKNFQSGMQMVRQLEFALFDFRLHREYDPTAGGRIYEILDEIRDEVAVIRPPAFNRFANGFSHIFAGGYASGYYSYKWAEVLSADAFSLFEEHGGLDRETGLAFLHDILERGGSEDAMDLFVRFRGREPSIEPLLRHSGIVGAAA